MKTSRIGRASTVVAAVALLCAATGAPKATEVDNAGPRAAGGRITWDQVAESEATIARYRFVLYVDGLPLPLDDATCGPPRGAGYPCDAALPALSPGEHTLALAVRDGRLESDPSAAVVVTIEPRAAAIEANSRSVSPVAAPSHAAPCGDAAGCVTAIPIVSVRAEMTSPTSTPDGRLLMIENGRHIRVVAEGRLVPEPAFSSASASETLVAVLLDPNRPSDVLVASVDSAGGERALVIRRLRDVQNRFGESRVLIPGIRLPDQGNPVLAMDADSRLYIAVPPADSLSGAIDPWHGALLRLTADGTVDWQGGQVSPVLARGIGRIAAMAVDVRSHRLWMVVGTESSRAELAWADTSARTWALHRAQPAAAAQGAHGIRALAFADLGAAPTRRFLLTARAPAVVDAWPLSSAAEPRARSDLRTVAGEIVAAASGFGAYFYVVGIEHRDGRATSTIYMGTVRSTPGV